MQRPKRRREAQFWAWFTLSCVIGALSKHFGGPLDPLIAWSFSSSAMFVAFWMCR
jgi:hypothetical protein